MSGGFPFGIEVCNGTNQGVNLANTNGTAVLSGASNVLGAFVQIVASTPYDCSWAVLVGDLGPSSNGARFLVNVAVGAAGLERIIASFSIQSGSANNPTFAGFPLAIPAGTRISAQCQTSSGADSCGVSVLLFDGAFTNLEGAAGVDIIGYVPGSTVSTTITPNASANTKGSFAQLIASTARDYMGLLIGADDAGTTSTTSTAYFVDIAIGGAGSEVIIIPNVEVCRVLAINTVTLPCSYIGFIAIPVPAGSRISARAQGSSATVIGIHILGVYQ